MQIRFTDYKDAEQAIGGKHGDQWRDIEQILEAMPLHVKGSDQKGIQGNLEFNPKGTNAYLKDAFVSREWGSNTPIPVEYRALGKDVDFWKEGVIVEVQFSNYPFLTNNVMRSDILYKEQVSIASDPVELLVIITKAHMFPAAQSTLYYEQAARQVSLLADNNAFDVPVRVVGLFEPQGATVDAIWTKYKEDRYSRKEEISEDRTIHISGSSASARSKLTVPDLSDPSNPSLFVEE